MPLANNHDAVLNSSAQVVGSKQLAPGILARIGKEPGSDSSIIHSILFKSTMFSPAQVQAWLAKHNMKPEKVEPAQKELARIERECKIIYRDGAERKVWGVVAEPG